METIMPDECKTSCPPYIMLALVAWREAACGVGVRTCSSRSAARTVKFLMVPPATVVNMQLVLQHNVAVHTMGAKSDMLQLAALMALFAAGLQYMRCGLKDH